MVAAAAHPRSNGRFHAAATRQVYEPAATASSHNGSMIPAPIGVLQLLSGQDQLAARRLRFEEEADPTGRLVVRHQLTLGASPTLSVEWQADPGWIGTAGRVVIFRNAVGFARTFDAIPLDQVDHGEQVIDSRVNDYVDLQLTEGSTYFTAMLLSAAPMSIVSRKIAGLRQKIGGSPNRVGAFVRFAVHVPGNRAAIERIDQQSQLLESATRNVKARERIARRLNVADRSLEVERHSTRTEIETDKRLGEFRGIQRTFARYIAEVESDPTLDDRQREGQVRQLEALLRATLAAANFPYIET